MTTAAPLLNVPTDRPSWDQWSFQLAQNISDCQQAILAQRQIALPQYQIYPRQEVDLDQWLQRVGIALDDICSILNVNSVDTENVDLNDPRALQAWVFNVYQEINSSRATLKI